MSSTQDKTASRSVSIKEGRTAKNFSTVGRLVTSTPDGESVGWVPEDAVLTEDDGVILTAVKNGEYIPDEGKFYTSANVNVKPVLVDKTFTENGTYKVTEKDVDKDGNKAVGYGTVTVKVKGGSDGGTGLLFFKTGTIRIGMSGVFNLSNYEYLFTEYSGGKS
ncbi:MAG: hypothetical protein MSH24_06285 [Lachnospiraceae bacterium]|nr:hypothetical protein [Lachnospiraceae bacterium]